MVVRKRSLVPLRLPFCLPLYLLFSTHCDLSSGLLLAEVMVCHNFDTEPAGSLYTDSESPKTPLLPQLFLRFHWLPFTSHPSEKHASGLLGTCHSLPDDTSIPSISLVSFNDTPTRYGHRTCPLNYFNGRVYKTDLLKTKQNHSKT